MLSRGIEAGLLSVCLDLINTCARREIRLGIFALVIIVVGLVNINFALRATKPLSVFSTTLSPLAHRALTPVLKLRSRHEVLYEVYWHADIF